jgi:hypothetical protein
VSSHFYIESNGNIHQFVNTNHTAYGAGDRNSSGINNADTINSEQQQILHFNKLRIVLVIVFLAATLVRVLAKSHDMEAAAALPGLEERERLEMKRLKLSVLLCLAAAVLIIVRRPQRNHPSETLSTEEDCSWLNHGGFPTKGFDGH